MTNARRVGATVAMAVLALAGCSQADESAGTPASQSPPASKTTSEASGPCALLTPAQVESLAGKKLDGRATTIAGSEIDACQFGDFSMVGVQVAKVPADEWAKSLPNLVKQIKASGAGGSAEMMAQLEKAADALTKGENLPPGRACEFFSTLIESQGQPANIRTRTAYLPNGSDPIAITGQSCYGDTFASVVVGRPDITTGGDLETSVNEILADLNPAQD